MKISIIYLLLIALLWIIVSASIVQQNQNVPKTDTEVEKLKIQLQTVENEKIGLETKLAEANARLINADFGKFERELRDSNNKWLWGWTGFFVGVVAIIGIAFWFSVRSLIADRVEKSLNGFKKSVDKVSILEDQLVLLKKEHAASVLENFIRALLSELERHPEQIKALPEEVLLDVFNDNTRDLEIRFAAIEVLAARKSLLFIFPVLNFLNSIVDSEIDWGTSSESNRYPFLFLDRLRTTHNEDAYHGLKNFMNRMIKEVPINKDIFLPWTVFSLADLGIELEIIDSVDMLKEIIPDLIELKSNDVILTTLAEYFDKCHEPEGIRQILEHPEIDEMPNVRTECSKLLEKYNSNNAESEESDESEPTE